ARHPPRRRREARAGDGARRQGREDGRAPAAAPDRRRARAGARRRARRARGGPPRALRREGRRGPRGRSVRARGARRALALPDGASSLEPLSPLLARAVLAADPRTASPVDAPGSAHDQRALSEAMTVATGAVL